MLVEDVTLLDEAGRALSLHDPLGRPLVVAFEAGDATDEDLRPYLRGLGARLLRIDEGGEHRLLLPDDPPRRVQSACDLRAVLGDGALIVIDGQRRVRARYEVGQPLLPALAVAATTLRSEPITIGRREVLVTALLAAFAGLFADGCAKPKEPTVAKGPPPGPSVPKSSLTLEVNGTARTLDVEPNVSLLDALRERWMLTGTKKGCDMGQCGACTVLVDGRRVLACLSLAVMHERSKITTIEGLAHGSILHPLQRMFVQHDGFQCGFCTPGQIMSAVGLIAEGHAKTDDEIREQMSGNLCRCGAYPNIVAAIQAARKEA